MVIYAFSIFFFFLHFVLGCFTSDFLYLYFNFKYSSNSCRIWCKFALVSNSSCVSGKSSFLKLSLVLLNDTYKLLQYFQDERLRLIFQKRLQFLLIYYLSLVTSLLKVTFVVIYKIVSYAF